MDTTWSLPPRRPWGRDSPSPWTRSPSDRAEVSAVTAGMAVAIPVAVYLMCLWVLHDRPEYRGTRLLGAGTAGLVLLTPYTGYAVPLTGAMLAALVGTKLVMRRSQQAG